MAKQQAIDDLIASYVSTFGEQPDNVTGMVIYSSAQRVVDGEWFRWVQDGQWRKIEWNPTDENLKCMQPGFIQSVIEKVNREDAGRKTTAKAD
jgi:hypothetical protein